MTQLFKQSGGNLMCVQVNDNEAEADLRTAGFKLLEELFPLLPTADDLDAVAAEDKAREATKPQRKGRKA